jgi:hypothetical protein
MLMSFIVSSEGECMLGISAGNNALDLRRALESDDLNGLNILNDLNKSLESEA